MNRGANIEIEIKLQLSSFAEYLKLLGFLGAADQQQQQTNAFFDTPNQDFSEGGWALRVRADNDRGFVTVKGLSSHSGAAAIREEIEEVVPRGKAVELIGGYGDLLSVEGKPIAFLLEKYPKATVVKLTEFNNLRTIKRLRLGDHDFELAVDKTEFADGSVDYELEVELEDQRQIDTAEDALRRLFHSLDIPFERQARSKYERALERSASVSD
ncbi:MAG: CYTH domain-containing protein [candidate division Zixibacteria bacterium]|nr:CYTH domain-containing protein [candidate division Zixibacteria bacterium]